jgi:hypothetical protein
MKKDHCLVDMGQQNKVRSSIHIKLLKMLIERERERDLNLKMKETQNEIL